MTVTGVLPIDDIACLTCGATKPEYKVPATVRAAGVVRGTECRDGRRTT